MLKRSARQVVIKITCYARENHVNIENNDAWGEQQGKAEFFFSCLHCIGALLSTFSNWGSGVTRGAVGGYRPLSTAQWHNGLKLYLLP